MQKTKRTGFEFQVTTLAKSNNNNKNAQIRLSCQLMKLSSKSFMASILSLQTQNIKLYELTIYEMSEVQSFLFRSMPTKRKVCVCLCVCVSSRKRKW